MSEKKIDFKYSNGANELQQYVKCRLDKSPYLIQRKIAVLYENSKTIDYDIEKAINSIGMCVVIATPTEEFTGLNDNKTNTFDTEFEITAIESPLIWRAYLEKNKFDTGTALDVANYISEYLSNYYSQDFGKFSTVNIEQGSDENFILGKLTLKASISSNPTGIIECDGDCCVDYDFALDKDLNELSTTVKNNTDNITNLSTNLSALPDRVDGIELSVSTNIENITDLSTKLSATPGDLTDHINDKTNPHEVNAEQLNVYTKTAADGKFALSSNVDYNFKNVSNGVLFDKAINKVSTNYSFTFPTRTDNKARDFIIYFANNLGSTVVNWPTNFTYLCQKEDTFVLPTDKPFLMSFTDISPNVLYVARNDIYQLSNIGA